MMMKKFALALMVIGLVACTDKGEQAAAPAKNEFDILCEHFTALVSSKNYPGMSVEERAEELDKALVANLNTAGNAYSAWSAIRNATPSDRNALYSDAALSTGYENWDCPAINQRGQEVGSAHD